MSFLDGLFARLYPRIVKGSEEKWLRADRADLLSEVSGDVVEIGAGTGLNLEHYGAGITSLVLTEPSPHMLKQLEEAAAKIRPDADVKEAPAQRLPVPDASADFVVSTLVLCSVPDVQAALAEVKRVLRPGGAFVVLEHVRGKGKIADRQRRAKPFTKFFGRGCHVSRDTKAALAAAGFDTTGIRDKQIDDEPKIYAPHIIGIARL